ncbi:hypothetical protein AWC17_04550 [Mycobacterium nebraskense]|uniref:Uncharacterized protein n=1 Tax=Mycobacterium nebraskense TaxID=244292 RepID=A0A0F5N664_9MYCO|nr:hypothetical protein WU83_23515 [Mycobacterium nebraskense]KLO34750.1 hypothetical protein ABW17_25275 [Mycobacterium nebraskense]ORW23170.1 hypothetical protein AWC17_04550 [Mycobacterium nebraskense]
MTRRDFQLGIAPQTREPRVTLLYAGTLVLAVVSGICALVALAAGSPLQFGVALALFGAGWIVTDFIERSERRQERFPRPCVDTVARTVPAYRPSRVVHAGRCEHFSRPAPRVVSKLAA